MHDELRQVDRRSSLSVLAASAAALAAGRAPSAETAQKQRPNIVFISADDLGFGDLTCGAAGGMEVPSRRRG